MTWFYWNSFALLVGAELNAELAKESSKGQLQEKNQPLGEDNSGSRRLIATPLELGVVTAINRHPAQLITCHADRPFLVDLIIALNYFLPRL